jgi:RNA polymerase sigma-70 factor (ECF subfamily)
MSVLGFTREGDAEARAHRDQARAGTQSQTLRDFEQFFREHEPRVSGYLCRMLGDAQAACDLSQETFFRAWQRFATLRTYDKPGAWLTRVATNLALQHLRRHHSRAAVGAFDPLDERLEPSEGEPGPNLALRDQVRETLMELPPRARALLVLREVYGYTAVEAAEALGMSLGATKMALCRARAQFRDTYLRKDDQA